MFWRARKTKTVAPHAAPIAPTPLRVMDAAEIALHVVEAMRETRYWLTRDMESVAHAWCAENNVEPIQLCHLRAAVQAVPGVRYARLNLRGPKFGPIRRALQDRGMSTDRQFVYEIGAVPIPTQSRSNPGAIPTQSRPIPTQSGTRRDRTEPDADYRKTRAA